MSRPRATFATLLIVVCFAAACGGGSDAKASTPTGTAMTVNGAKISAKQVVDELHTIAANDRLARALKKEDDTVLVPKPGTIAPEVSQAWLTRWVNQILADHEFHARGLHVTAKDRALAQKSMEEVFRGAAVFAAFPESFRKVALEREARTAALQATFPATHEPTEADLQALYGPVAQTCQDNKLIAQIYVDTKDEADQIAAQLAAGADFATLARQRSTDSSSDSGGVAMCIGSQRFQSSEDVIQQAARQTPIGGTSAPVKAADGYAILRVLPLTYDNTRPLLASEWHTQHPTPFYDFLAAKKAQAKITINPRYTIVTPAGGTVVIGPALAPVKL